jgi:hypothetical protein
MGKTLLSLILEGTISHAIFLEKKLQSFIEVQFPDELPLRRGQRRNCNKSSLAANELVSRFSKERAICGGGPYMLI